MLPSTWVGCAKAPLMLWLPPSWASNFRLQFSFFHYTKMVVNPLQLLRLTIEFCCIILLHFSIISLFFLSSWLSFGVFICSMVYIVSFFVHQGQNSDLKNKRNSDSLAKHNGGNFGFFFQVFERKIISNSVKLTWKFLETHINQSKTNFLHL